jgi:hypothetical protein
MSISELQKIAEAATQGPWTYEVGGYSECSEPSCCSEYWDNRIWCGDTAGDRYLLLESHLLEPEDAKYIATFNPTTVLTLLNEIKQLREWKLNTLS